MDSLLFVCVVILCNAGFSVIQKEYTRKMKGVGLAFNALVPLFAMPVFLFYGGQLSLKNRN